MSSLSQCSSPLDLDAITVISVYTMTIMSYTHIITSLSLDGLSRKLLCKIDVVRLLHWQHNQVTTHLSTYQWTDIDSVMKAKNPTNNARIYAVRMTSGAEAMDIRR